MIETAVYRPNPRQLSVEGVAGFLNEVFSSLADEPRPFNAEIDLRGGGTYALDLVDGEIVVRGRPGEEARTGFGRRWIAEHPVPFALRRRRILALRPAGGNRVKVRAKFGIMIHHEM